MANCLAQVFYYEFESKPLLAKQIRTVWERLSILNQNVNAYVHQEKNQRGQASLRRIKGVRPF